MNANRIQQEKPLVAIKRTIDAQPRMVLASGNEAVAGIAEALTRLSPTQRTFLRVRYYFDSDEACANILGIPKTTLRDWKKKPAFAAARADLFRQPVLQARADLVLLVQKAVHTLGELLDDPNPRIRLDAAEMVLKSRDVQLLTNNVKIDSNDEEDLYTMTTQRLAARLRQPAPPTIREPRDGAA